MTSVQDDIVPNHADKPNLNLPKSHELENIRSWNIFTQLVIVILLVILHLKLLTDYFRDRTPLDPNASVLTKDQRKKVLLFEANKEVGNTATLMANDDDDE